MKILATLSLLYALNLAIVNQGKPSVLIPESQKSDQRRDLIINTLGLSSEDGLKSRRHKKHRARKNDLKSDVAIMNGQLSDRDELSSEDALNDSDFEQDDPEIAAYSREDEVSGWGHQKLSDLIIDLEDLYEENKEQETVLLTVKQINDTLYYIEELQLWIDDSEAEVRRKLQEISHAEKYIKKENRKLFHISKTHHHHGRRNSSRHKKKKSRKLLMTNPFRDTPQPVSNMILP